MKSTGIVRKLDNLGRIVLPIELRRVLDIDVKDGLEIYINEDEIILRKYQPSQSCIFCEEATEVTKFRDKTVCKHCLKSITNSVA
jgi:transcriptional pleiotropic regulator of transition state genes